MAKRCKQTPKVILQQENGSAALIKKTNISQPAAVTKSVMADKAPFWPRQWWNLCRAAGSCNINVTFCPFHLKVLRTLSITVVSFSWKDTLKFMDFFIFYYFIVNLTQGQHWAPFNLHVVIIKETSVILIRQFELRFLSCCCYNRWCKFIEP